MRPFSIFRLALCTVVCVILAVAALASVSAQTPAPTPTTNPMVATMALEQGSCPQGQAKTLLTSMMSMTEEPIAGATAEATAGANQATPTASRGLITSMKCLFGQFSGAAEVPGPGASNAQGVVLLSVHGSTGNICYEVALANITLPATELHLDKGNAGKSGSMAVSFHPRPDKNGLAVGCVTVGPALATDIESHPANYYVNVFTTDFKNGAARAQLTDWNPAMPMTMATPLATAAATAAATEAVKGA